MPCRPPRSSPRQIRFSLAFLPFRWWYNFHGADLRIITEVPFKARNMLKQSRAEHFCQELALVEVIAFGLVRVLFQPFGNNLVRVYVLESAKNTLNSIVAVYPSRDGKS